MLTSLEAEAGGSLRITPETQPGVQVQHGQCEETAVKKRGKYISVYICIICNITYISLKNR